MTELYTYQVARVRSRELALLNRQDIESLMSAKTFADCLRVLFDKGWGTGSEKTGEEIFAAENQKLWEFMEELLKGDMKAFDVLLYPIDYNNLKAAIKSAVTDNTPHNVFKSGGTVNTEKMEQAVKNNDFSVLPKNMARAGEVAYKTLLQTRDGQLCDMIIDKACLDEIYMAGQVSKEALVKEYAELTVAIANIKIAVRCQKTAKSLTFISEALSSCGSINTRSMAVAAAKSLEELYSFILNTNYAPAVEKLKESASAFEKWCDDRLMELIKKQKINPFTIGPLMAYVIARQNEIATVRVILSGKLNGLEDSIIRERLRDTYV